MSSSSPAEGAAAQPFPNYLQMRAYLPGWAWGVLRACSVLAALGTAGLLASEIARALPRVVKDIAAP